MEKTGYKFHPIADIFPLMEDSEYDDLKNDIAENGLLEPIWVYDGMILDGRNRYRVCDDLGIKPEIKVFDNGSPMSFVVSLNLRRRHLNSSQRAMAASESIQYYKD